MTEPQRKPGELSVTKISMIGPAWAVLLGLLIRYSLKAIMAVLAMKMATLAVNIATGTPGGQSATLVIKGLFRAAGALIK